MNRRDFIKKSLITASILTTASLKKEVMAADNNYKKGTKK